MARDRRFDLLLFGATGFTGRLVARYLAASAPPDLRWAVVGRDRAKLEDVVDGLGPRRPSELVVADALDPAAMARVAADATAVCTTVGPYRRYGAPLIAACAAAGTAYCDLTGEVPFVREAIERHHATARATGARLVPCCGFDSIPSDLSVWVLQEALTARVGRGAPAVTAVFRMKGGASGGTIASALGMIDDARRDPALRRLLADPYALDPDDGVRGRDRDRVGPGYDRALGEITAPFVMQGINARVVRRSHALAGRPWGTDWRYQEVLGLGRSVRAGLGALAVSAALPAFAVASQLPVVRPWLDRRLPAPGQGPSAEARAAGRYQVRTYGTVDGATVTATFADQRDPGYDGTAVLLGEAALTLALDPPSTGGGVLTPAFALAPRLVPRLRAAGLRIEVG
jgi:short subunit dehydrogenase-like uncharacterized protein